MPTPQGNCDIHPGVLRTLRRKKACAFQHFVVLSLLKKTFSCYNGFWTVPFLEELPSLKRNASQELTILNLLRP